MLASFTTIERLMCINCWGYAGYQKISLLFFIVYLKIMARRAYTLILKIGASSVHGRLFCEVRLSISISIIYMIMLIPVVILTKIDSVSGISLKMKLRSQKKDALSYRLHTLCLLLVFF